jgi:hypothetical protein
MEARLEKIEARMVEMANSKPVSAEVKEGAPAPARVEGFQMQHRMIPVHPLSVVKGSNPGSRIAKGSQPCCQSKSKRGKRDWSNPFRHHVFII